MSGTLWQNRLKEVAKILEVEVEELINADDNGVYIAEIKDNNVGYNNSQVTIKNPATTGERGLFERIIIAKDEQIKALTQINQQYEKAFNELESLRELVKNLKL
jgi:hypothetical protein